MDTQLQPMVINEGGGVNSLWNNPFIYLIFFLFFGKGFMNGFGGDGAPASAVQQQLSNDFLYTNLSSQNRDIAYAQANGFVTLNNGLSALGYENARGQAAIQSSIDSCCCETQKGIMQQTYQLTSELNRGFSGVERGLCDLGYNLTAAIHADGEATRALINANTMQDLRDRLDAAQTANALSAQTLQLQQYINGKIPVPAPAPAFCVPGPYGAC